MTTHAEPVRLGAVSYLNTRPLVVGLTEAGYSVEADVPSVCWQKLIERRIDVGLVPAIGLADEPALAIVPDVAIACHGPVRSVLLLAARPIHEIRSVACDTSSRSSVAMVRILLGERYRIEPRFRPAPPDWRAMLAEHDAALIIGDAALAAAVAARDRADVDVHDLGREWVEHTGLPFVFAVWAGFAENVDERIARDLASARDRGLASLESLVDATADRDTRESQLGYLRDAIHYGLGERERRGLRLFLELAYEYRLVPHRVSSSLDALGVASA